VVATVLALGLVIYLLGLRRAGDKTGRQMAFLAGFGCAALALVTPLDALGDQYFSAHMVQHLILIIGAAPLLAWSGGLMVMARILPAAVREAPAVRQIVGWSMKPGAAWCAAAAFVVTVTFWHLPVAHDWASVTAGAHAAEHLSVLVTATLFWSVVLTSGERRITQGSAAVMVSLVGLCGALLSAVIMFAPQQLCSSYAHNPISDQVLAGLLMCIPASFAYVGSTIWALWRLIGGAQSHAG
jgi:putative membrane protein